MLVAIQITGLGLGLRNGNETTADSMLLCSMPI